MKSRSFWILIALVCLFLACLATNYDYDLFARLIVGEDFIEKGILPYKDYLSYTPTHPWFDHEWGSGVVFYALLKYLGAFGLVLFQAVTMFGTAFFMVKTQELQKISFPKSITFTTIFLTMFYYLNSNLVRCQLFSFLFFSAFLYILEKTRKKDSNIIFLIPLITLFWNNVHGGVVAGLGILLIYTITAAVERRNYKKYLVVLTLSLFSLIINPYGIKYLEFLFSATTMTRKYVIEWWSAFNKYHFRHFLPITAYITLVPIYSLIRIKRFDLTKYLVLTVTIIEGLIHVKLLSFALICVSIFCYKDICLLTTKFKNLILKIEKVLPIVIIFFGLSIPMFSPLIARADYNKFPLKEVEFLKINNIKGNILTTFGFGSYVSYKLYPDNLIYMDGRYEEVYNNKEFLALRDYELAEPNWQDVITNYDTEILMPVKSIEVYEVLKQNKDWVLVYEGNFCGIFVKKDKVKTSYKTPNYDINYYRKTLFNRASKEI